MNDAEQHDRTASALASALRSLLAPAGEWSVLSRARWQPLEGFPDCVYIFDVMIVESEAKLDLDASRGCLGPDVLPTTIIDVIRRDDWEEEFYDKPDILYQSGVYEYCLWDPTAERLRPPLHALRRRDSGYRNTRTSTKGVFFSTTGFRLDIDGADFTVSRCSQACEEEELFIAERLLDAALKRAEQERSAVDSLTAKVERLRAELGGSGS
jgi:hypothetical protein